MSLYIHELHAAAVHAPLVLLPTAAAVDLSAAIRGDARRAHVGAWLWWGAAAGGVLAGLSGFAASQEVKADDPVADDRMWLHGAGNTLLLVGLAGLAVHRTRHAPSRASVICGFTAVAWSVATAYLGGQLVYQHGLGVKAMPEEASGGVSWSPRVLSRTALPSFLRDAVRGMGWLVDRARRALRSGRAALHERPSQPAYPLWAGDDATAV